MWRSREEETSWRVFVFSRRSVRAFVYLSWDIRLPFCSKVVRIFWPGNRERPFGKLGKGCRIYSMSFRNNKIQNFTIIPAKPPFEAFWCGTCVLFMYLREVVILRPQWGGSKRKHGFRFVLAPQNCQNGPTCANQTRSESGNLLGLKYTHIGCGINRGRGICE